jgi:polar amino acid transport system permease protein
MRRVVLPQATRVIIPPTGNEFIAMMKDTALVGFLGVTVGREELFGRAKEAGESDLRKLEALLVAAGMYWALTAVFTFFQRKLERRMGRGYERGSQKAVAPPGPHLLSMGTDGPGLGGTHLPAGIELETDPGGEPPP